MAAAIIELDALADAVWTATQDDHFFAVRRPCLAFDVAHDGALVGRVHVGGLCFEFGSTSVDAFEDRVYAHGMADVANLRFGMLDQFGKAGVGEAHHFEVAHALFGCGQAFSDHNSLGVDDLADAGKEPRVKFGDRVDVDVGHAVAHGLGDGADAVRVLLGQGLGDGGCVRCARNFDFVEACEARFHRGQCLLHGFVEGAADGHSLAHGFHRRCEVNLGTCEFLEGKAWDFGDDIVDCGLERCRCDACDVVVQFVEGVADGELGRDFRNRETCGLGGERGGAGHAGVHLDDDHAAVRGVYRPLYV